MPSGSSYWRRIKLAYLCQKLSVSLDQGIVRCVGIDPQYSRAKENRARFQRGSVIVIDQVRNVFDCRKGSTMRRFSAILDVFAPQNNTQVVIPKFGGSYGAVLP